MEDDRFLTWEAVVCHEQGLPLTRQQKAVLSELINFGDPDDEQILYLNEIPRTTEPWYEILRKIAPRLLVELNLNCRTASTPCLVWVSSMTRHSKWKTGSIASTTSLRTCGPARIRWNTLASRRIPCSPE